VHGRAADQVVQVAELVGGIERVGRVRGANGGDLPPVGRRADDRRVRAGGALERRLSVRAPPEARVVLEADEHRSRGVRRGGERRGGRGRKSGDEREHANDARTVGRPVHRPTLTGWRSQVYGRRRGPPSTPSREERAMAAPPNVDLITRGSDASTPRTWRCSAS
jgi:hypothetical protein